MNDNYTLHTIAPEDPRQGNTSRDVLLNIIQGLYPPANYRVMFGVNPDTERLYVKVLHRSITEVRLFKWTIWRQTQPWTEIRRIEGRTYSSLLRQLAEHPEFLEFEVIVDGIAEANVIQAL